MFWFCGWRGQPASLEATPSPQLGPAGRRSKRLDLEALAADVLTPLPSYRLPHEDGLLYNQKMSLVVVGSVAYGGVETAHGRVERMLGGAATYIALSASYFTQARIVAVVGDDFAEADTELLA